MNDTRPLPQDQETPAATPVEDARLPYEAPRLLKKRSVAQATLFTSVGTKNSMLTTQG
jgi:hypothetical protein